MSKNRPNITQGVKESRSGKFRQILAELGHVLAGAGQNSRMFGKLNQNWPILAKFALKLVKVWPNLVFF